MNSKIKTDKINISKLFEDFWYIIPNYQRHYVWKVDNVNTLLDDLYEHHKLNLNKNVKSEYFLGSLVLQKHENSDIYDVLDGQQRLTTLLLLLSIIRNKTNNIENCDHYIKQAASITKRIDKDRNRIEFEIRDNIKDFVKKYIYDYNITDCNCKLEEIKTNINSKNISINNLSNALIAINDYLDEFSKEDLIAFYTTILNDVVVIYVATENEEDAFRLFRILNSRGVPLSSSDIIKSMNLECIQDKKEQETYAKMWEELENDFEPDEFERFLSYIRTIFVKQKAKSSLLSEFEKIIYNKDKPLLKKGKDTFDFIKKYKNIYDVVIMLDEDKSESKVTLGNEYKNLIAILNYGFTSTDWIPPLMLYYKKYQTEGLLDFLKKLEAKCLADVICKETPTRRLDALNKILATIENSQTYNEVLNNVDIFKWDKNNVENIIKNEGIYGQSFDKYLLLKYEYLNQDNSTHISKYEKLSIEHVLPQNPLQNSKWLKDFSQNEIDKWTNNIANLIIISGRKNSSLSNADFEEKKKRLNSKIQDIFTGSREILNKTEWTPTILENRLQTMCNKLFNV